MSDRNNRRDDNALSFILGAGAITAAAALGVTLAAGAIMNAPENEPGRRRSRQNEDEDSPINWGEVFNTVGSIAGAVAAGADMLNGISAISAPDSSTRHQSRCDICCQAMSAMWGGTQELSCKHRFHKVCLRKWKETNRRCPTCGSLVLL